jgi:uncharacterized protein (TIGR00303 family)
MIREHYGSFINYLKNKNFAYILIIGTTEISKIPGITIAGATPELTHFTPAADAEFLILGRCKVINTIPVTPDGLPTPAIITRAALSFLNPFKLIVDAGSSIKPKVPYVSLNGEPGKDIRKKAFERGVVERLLENAITLGEELSNQYEVIVIGESIPAGTTTAMAVLASLGYDAFGKVSSSSPNNPMSLKINIVKEALKDLPSDLIGKLSKVADPVLIGVAGVSLGFKGKILLAGGTQMVAAVAIIKELNGNKLNDIAIGTTRWIIEDKSSDMLGLAKQVGIRVIEVLLNFSDSKYEGLKLYERGYVKEGVGAGGASIMAFINGITNEQLLDKIENIYKNLLL